MIDDFASLFRYHKESEARYFEACRALTTEQYTEPEAFEVGWPSIRSVIVHLAWANDLWVRRLLGENATMRVTETDFPTLESARLLSLEAHDRIARQVLPDLTPERLAADFTYIDLAGKPRSLPLWAALRHLINHGTYHRGQLASKFSRKGITPPVTDMLYWAIDFTSQPESA